MSRVVWDCSPKSGGKLLPRLNSDGKPIANKYCEGKMKRTLERELTDLKSLGRKASAWDLFYVQQWEAISIALRGQGAVYGSFDTSLNLAK